MTWKYGAPRTTTTNKKSSKNSRLNIVLFGCSHCTFSILLCVFEILASRFSAYQPITINNCFVESSSERSSETRSHQQFSMSGWMLWLFIINIIISQDRNRVTILAEQQTRMPSLQRNRTNTGRHSVYNHNRTSFCYVYSKLDVK